HATEPSPSARAAAAIAQLGSTSSEQRDAASRTLEALGAAALEPLWEASQSSDAEVRRRARLLVQTIERRLEPDRLLQPTRVRLVYRETPLREAAADLGRKTGFAVKLGGATTRTLTLDTGLTSLWQAVAQFCRKTNLTERPPSTGPIDPTPYDPWDR